MCVGCKVFWDQAFQPGVPETGLSVTMLHIRWKGLSRHRGRIVLTRVNPRPPEINVPTASSLLCDTSASAVPVPWIGKGVLEREGWRMVL